MLGTVQGGSVFEEDTAEEPLWYKSTTEVFVLSSILIAMLSGIRENNAVKTLLPVWVSIIIANYTI